MSQYFPKPSNSHFGDSIKVKIDLFNYATKAVDTLGFVLKTNLTSLKTKVDKLDIDKLKPLPDDVSKLSNVVTNEVVKKTEYDKLFAKVDNIHASDFVLKTQYNTDKTELEKKIPDTNGFVKKANYKTKITELENKIPDISNLAAKTTLTTAENKIPSVSNLVKKQTIILKLQKLKMNLITIIMINILIL